jgi:hypothetical protein
MTKRNKIWGIILSVLFTLSALWLLIFRTSDVLANLEASYICMVPAFVTSHIVLHRKINKTIKENLNGSSN